jgi:hypothetical protein
MPSGLDGDGDLFLLWPAVTCGRVRASTGKEKARRGVSLKVLLLGECLAALEGSGEALWIRILGR